MYEHHLDHGDFRGQHSMYEGRGRGHGGREPRFGLHGDRRDRFDGPRSHGFVTEGRAGCADTAVEGDDTMHGNHWEGRSGGLRGKDRQGFGFGRGPNHSERTLEQGDLRWLVLHLIAEQPRHGYEIIKAIEEMFNGGYAPSPGVIYPTLTFLEETGLIVGETQATKKRYSITEEGRAALDANAAAIQAMRTRIEETRMRFGGPPAPEMRRAMDNLRAAVHVRLAKGELSPESLAAVTAALDRAAGEIERS